MLRQRLRFITALMFLNVFSISSLKAEEKNHLSTFYVYTDRSGLKYYEFEVGRQTYSQAQSICHENGLRLMTLKEAIKLKKELKKNPTLLSQWLANKEVIDVWTSTPHSQDENFSWRLIAYANGFVVEYTGYNEHLNDVRCVDL